MKKEERNRVMDAMIDYYFTVNLDGMKNYLQWYQMDTKEQVYIRKRLYARGIEVEEFFKYFKVVRDDARQRVV